MNIRTDFGVCPFRIKLDFDWLTAEVSPIAISLLMFIPVLYPLQSGLVTREATEQCASRQPLNEGSDCRSGIPGNGLPLHLLLLFLTLFALLFDPFLSLLFGKPICFGWFPCLAPLIWVSKWMTPQAWLSVSPKRAA